MGEMTLSRDLILEMYNMGFQVDVTQNRKPSFPSAIVSDARGDKPYRTKPSFIAPFSGKGSHMLLYRMQE